MKRRKFLLTSGSAVLTGSTISSLQRPAVGLEFEISQVQSSRPTDIDSVLLDFTKFDLSTRYLDQSKNIEIEIKIDIGDLGSDKIITETSISDNEFTKTDISEYLPLSIDGINTSKSDIVGEIKIVLRHPTIGSKSYRKSFTISDFIRDGFLAYYPMENSGSAILQDGVRSSIGQINGASWTSGKIGKSSLNFTEGNHYVGLGDKNRWDINTGENRTITTWVYMNSTGHTGCPIVKRDPSDNYNGWWIDEDGNGALRWGLTDRRQNSTNIYIKSDKINTGEWYHVAAVCDQNNNIGKLLINGGDHTEKSIDISGIDECSTSTQMYIGGRHNNRDQYWDGYIDDTRIYDRALSKSEINTISNNLENVGNKLQESDIISQSSNGISRWKFDNTSDTSTAEDSWSTHNGSINGGSYSTDRVYGNQSLNVSSTDYVRINDISPYNALSNLTLSLWANFDSFGSTYQTIAAKSNDQNATDDFGIRYVGSSTLQYFIATEGHDFRSVKVDIGNIESSEWHHYALTWSKSSAELRVFIDGKRVTKTSTLSEVTDTSDPYLEFGIRDVSNKSYPFADKIDDIRVYSREFTDQDMKNLFRKSSYRIN